MSIFAISSAVASRPKLKRGRDSSRARASSRSSKVSPQRRHSPCRSSFSEEGSDSGTGTFATSGLEAGGPPGEHAQAQAQAKSKTKAIRKSELHAPVAAHLPRAKVVEVIAGVGASHREKIRAGRLGVTGLIGGAAHEGRGLALPVPELPEAGVALWKNRLLELGIHPGPASVDAQLDP